MQIHELNNFTGTLGSGAYLAVDDGNDTGKLSTQQLLAATEARIDNIIAGPAPSAQEVTDARRGADGVTYSSLGTAIRTQVTDLKSDYLDISTDLTQTGYLEQSITWEQGAIGSTGDTDSANRIRCNYLRFFAESVTFTPNSGYWFAITEYDADKKTILSQSPSWIQGATTITPVATHYYRLVVRYASNYNITPSVGTQIVISYVDKLKNAISESNIYDYIKGKAIEPKLSSLSSTFGNATLSGNTITVNSQNSGAETARFTSAADMVRVKYKGAKTVPYMAVQLIYTTSSGDTYVRLATISDNTFEDSVSFNPSYYASLGATSYRILINSVDSSGTGTITLSNIEVTELAEYQANQLYNQSFPLMIKNVFDAIGTGNRVFEVGTGKDYTSILEALVDAMEYENAIVHVNAGTYDLVDEYKALYGDSYFDNFSYSSSGMGGLFLKNNVHLIFDANNTVTLNYTGSNTDVQTYFSAFNAGEKGFTIENMNLETSNIRYAIHDEMNGSETPNHNRYINCKIKHDSSGTTWGAHQCIGGGLGASTMIEISGCYFDSVGANHAVSYHNSNKGGASNYKSKIEMHDCYFENGSFYIGNFGNGTKVSEAYVSNCSFKSIAPSYYYDSSNGADNGKLIAWNNEMRNV